MDNQRPRLPTHRPYGAIKIGRTDVDQGPRFDQRRKAPDMAGTADSCSTPRPPASLNPFSRSPDPVVPDDLPDGLRRLLDAEIPLDQANSDQIL